MDRWIGEWPYYHFAAGSFHTKKLCRRLYLIEVHFYFKKTKKSLLSHLYGHRGNLRTPPAKLVVDFLFVIIQFFAISYGSDVISGNLSKSAFLEGGGSL